MSIDQLPEPTPEALALVPVTMAGVYKVMPLLYHDNVLQVAVAEGSEDALKDIKDFLGVGEVRIHATCTRAEIDDLIGKYYTSTSEPGDYPPLPGDWKPDTDVE